MTYDFDRIIDRSNTGSVKHDFKKENGQEEDVIPLWVADMDFATAPEVIKRVKQAAEFGVYGYSESMEGYERAVVAWCKEHFGWKPEKEWMVKTPGIVFALHMAIKAFTGEGEAVLIQPPVYHPFRRAIVQTGRRVVNSPLKLERGRYEMDFEDLERKITEERVKLFILCSPHNPVGRVWSREELQQVGEICARHKVFVVSDEIHGDFTYSGRRHLCFAGIDPEFEKNCMVCTAPSKTFNLAGLQISNIFIPDEKRRENFENEIARVGLGEVGLMGIVACQAAYEKGGPWLCSLREYLEGNLIFVRDFLKRELPRITLVEPEGTYLLWLDMRALGLSSKQRRELLEKKARIWVNDGAMFGEEGEGFVRVNIACPRSVLEKAFDRLRDAVNQEV